VEGKKCHSIFFPTSTFEKIKGKNRMFFPVNYYWRGLQDATPGASTKKELRGGIAPVGEKLRGGIAPVGEKLRGGIAPGI